MNTGKKKTQGGGKSNINCIIY